MHSKVKISIMLLLHMSFGIVSAKTILIEAERLTVKLSDQGEIIGVTLNDGVHRSAVAQTLLAGTCVDGPVVMNELQNGGVRFTKKHISDRQNRSCILQEQFQAVGDSVRWEIDVVGTDQPWSTAIETHLFWPTPKNAAIWAPGSGGKPSTKYGWNDPLVPMSFLNKELRYGARTWKDANAISLPLVTVLEPATDQSLSLVLSPEGITFDMMFRCDSEGKIVFSRSNNRIEAGRSVHFAMDLVAHPADWRPAVGWMTRRYPAYFDPPNPKAYEIAGCGAYSSHSQILDVEKLRKMAFRMNWKASFDFPYMGMFIPPMRSDTQTWVDFKERPSSIRKMADYSRRMRAAGFYVLNYFNVTEFGTKIQFPPPPKKTKDDADLWKNPNDFLYYSIGDAVVLGPEARPWFSWNKCVVMDPGEPCYQKFLLNQARRHIEKLTESSGICIDRMDWLRLYNTRRDDGITWYNNAPARSLVSSWHDIMSRLGPVMHRADKVIFCNPHYRRVDLLREIDGVYDEFGQYGFSMNLCAFLTVRKPLIEWTIDVPELRHNPDAFFQRHLYIGAFPTAPVPGNDHCIGPDPDIEKHYIDYAPLLDTLRGRKWVLLPHVVKAVDGDVRVNLFEVPGGYVLAVTFGGHRTKATVVISGLTNNVNGRFRIEALHPAAEKPAPVAATAQGNLLTLRVPLVRGCAMVKLVEKK